jgi:hypothetical protein
VAYFEVLSCGQTEEIPQKPHRDSKQISSKCRLDRYHNSNVLGLMGVVVIKGATKWQSCVGCHGE